MQFGTISPYILAIIAAWIFAHLAKYVVDVIKGEKNILTTLLFRSGGMPSGHSATVMAVTVVIGLKDGFSTGLFGLAVIVAGIAMYDAMNVRRSSGEQGLIIHGLVKDNKSDTKLPRIALGHSPLEVLAGAMLGIVVGVVVFLATN